MSTSSFRFFTENGKIFALKENHLDLEGLHNALLNQDFAQLQKYQSFLQIEQIADSEEITASNQNLICLNKSIGVFIDDAINDILDFDEEIVKTLVPQNGNNLIVLDKSGKFHIICKMSMIEWLAWQPENFGQILDFQILEDEHDPILKMILVVKDPTR